MIKKGGREWWKKNKKRKKRTDCLFIVFMKCKHLYKVPFLNKMGVGSDLPKFKFSVKFPIGLQVI